MDSSRKSQEIELRSELQPISSLTKSASDALWIFVLTTWESQSAEGLFICFELAQMDTGMDQKLLGFALSGLPLGAISRRQRPGMRRACSRHDVAQTTMTSSTQDPLLVRCARGELVERPPVWLMRQAGRYMADFRKFSEKIPFRERSETPEIAVELSLQPWKAFQTDAVIMFSDILTPLPALGIDFDIRPGQGPRFPDPLRSRDQVASVLDAKNEFQPETKLAFVGEILSNLRREITRETTLIGFVGCPWTLAAYAVEGGNAKALLHTKQFMYNDPDTLKGSSVWSWMEIEKY